MGLSSAIQRGVACILLFSFDEESKAYPVISTVPTAMINVLEMIVGCIGLFPSCKLESRKNKTMWEVDFYAAGVSSTCLILLLLHLGFLRYCSFNSSRLPCSLSVLEAYPTLDAKVLSTVSMSTSMLSHY